MKMNVIKMSRHCLRSQQGLIDFRILVFSSNQTRFTKSKKKKKSGDPLCCFECNQNQANRLGNVTDVLFMLLLAE